MLKWRLIATLEENGPSEIERSLEKANKNELQNADKDLTFTNFKPQKVAG